MDLREEERANRGNKRVLSEIDVSEWEITCKETRPREGKQRCDASKATQLPVSETRSRAARLRKKKKKKLRLIKRQPGHYRHNFPNLQHQDQSLRATKCAHGKNPIFRGKPDQLNSMGNTSIQEPLPLPLVNSNLGTRFFLRGVGCDAPGF
jgi:hypothetical protein